MSMKQPRPLADVLGENLKTVRKQHALTLDEVAKETRSYGAKWTAQRIAGMEAGKVSVTVPTVCTLAWALSAITDNDVHPADLLRSDSPVEVNGDFAVGGNTIAETLEGNVGELRIKDAADPDRTIRDVVDAAGETASAWGPGVTVGDIRSLQSRIGLADRRAADRLGIDVHTLSGEAFRRWAMLLSEAVDEQAGPGASPQRKGHITRKLEAELREALDRGDD
ncbi:hypothetical protein BSP109_00208 [Brevibacterium sp. Mu109]|nr:hypothetical protein BSP109_00208 [Brevibacterium sp. Mu109]